MYFVYNYMLNSDMRHMLNHLAQNTFGITFEPWVTKQYFRGEYIPYSYIEDGKMLSNVSVNRMQFMQNGVKRNYIQIGTVMTEGSHRKQGLASRLMQHVIRQYASGCDGMYLFADLNALDFYRKLGFQEGMQYQYHLKESLCSGVRTKEAFVPVKENDVVLRRKYEDAVQNGASFSSLEQTNRFGLQMFYTADLDQVFYAKDLDCFVVMEEEDDTLFLQSVVCRKKTAMKEILKRIHMNYHHLMLGFTPCAEDADLFEAEPYDGADDYRLFYLGDTLKSIEQEKLYFPDLSHA